MLAVEARSARDAVHWHDELAALRIALAKSFTRGPQSAMARVDAGDLDAWRAEVRAITEAIDRGECAKIVAARRAIVSAGGELDPADQRAQLEDRHPDCARVLIRPPGAATLIAATPERLVRVDGDLISCEALAGSRARCAEVAAFESSPRPR